MPPANRPLASDLRWLIDTGRVIEFSDGHLDLPLAPAKNEPAAKPEPAPVAAAEAARCAPWKPRSQRRLPPEPAAGTEPAAVDAVEPPPEAE